MKVWAASSCSVSVFLIKGVRTAGGDHGRLTAMKVKLFRSGSEIKKKHWLWNYLKPSREQFTSMYRRRLETNCMCQDTLLFSTVCNAWLIFFFYIFFSHADLLLKLFFVFKKNINIKYVSITLLFGLIPHSKPKWFTRIYEHYKRLVCALTVCITPCCSFSQPLFHDTLVVRDHQVCHWNLYNYTYLVWRVQFIFWILCLRYQSDCDR